MTIILQHKIIMSAVLLFFIVAIMIQVLLSRFYTLLILETENMATTKVPLLCQCKRKFTNTYRLNNGILNVPVFVERFLNRVRMGKLKVSTWRHLSGQLILLSVFTAGLGACLGIVQGSTIGEILPFYIVSMFGLYVYFAISGAVDINEKKEVLKTNLIDYMENHMGNKLDELEESFKKLDSFEIPIKDNLKKGPCSDTVRKRTPTAELEELLREFLA
ncbi:MAG: hypothetical protein J6C63_03650 [Lachnospiraceae bacterium]|nr:hypothetical protein [Lachnospiraceae bacterium]